MSFRKIGGINRSSNNHIVTSEYAASSKLVSKEIGGDYSDDTVIIYNSDICGNINVSVDKNILARGTLTIYDDISGFSTLDISDDITGHSNLLIHKDITGYQKMDISGHIRGHDDLTIFGDISGHGTLDIDEQITGYNTLTVHSDISGFSTLDISGDITGHNNLLIHKDISGNGLLDIGGNITGYSEQTIHGNMFGLADLDVTGEIRGHTRLLIDDPDDPVNGLKLDVSNIVYSHTHIHGESTMEIMGDISGQSDLFIENNITGHGTLDISGDITGYSNLTIYEDISGYGTLDISGELRGHSRLLVNNDTELKLDVSNIVHSHTHIQGDKTLDISDNITGHSNLTIFQDISGYGTLDISGELRGHSRLLVNNGSELKLDVSNIVYSHTHIHGESTMEIMGDISGQSNLYMQNNITGHGTLDISDNITGHNNLTIYKDISGHGLLDISGDITGKNNLTIFQDISGYGLLDISGDISGKNNLTISFDISGGNDLDISNNIRGRNRLQIFNDSEEVIDISNTICGYKDTILKQNLDICGQIIGYSGLYIEGDISGNNNLDISNNIVARNRLQILNNDVVRLDVSSGVFAYANVTVSGEIEGTHGLIIEGDISGNSNLEINGNITGHKGLTIFKGLTSSDKIIDVSDSLVTIYKKLELDDHFQANDISCSNIEVESGSNIVLQNGNIDVSGSGYVHIRGENSEGNGLTVEKNVLIKGNLTVNQGDVTLLGSTTKIHTTNLDVCDNIIEMHRLNDMAAGIIITNDSSGAVDDRKVFIGYNPSTTIGTSGVTQDAIIFTKIADTDISDNDLTDELKNDDNNLMWLKARGIDVQNFVVKEQSATVSEVQGLQHLHQTIIDGGLSANGQTVLNSTNIYNKLSFYELPDASNVFERFFDASGTEPQKVLETNNNYYFIYDVSGEYRLQIQTGYNSASYSTSAGYIEYDYIVCGGGADGSLNGLTAYGGDISFNYDNIDIHGIRDDATTYINVGGAGQNTKIDISYNISYKKIEGSSITSTTTDEPHAVIVDVSGGQLDVSYNSQFEYAYDSYQFPDRANFKIQLGHAGDASYNFGIKLNYENQELDYSNNVIDYSNTDISLNGFYGSGAKPGGIGGDGVVVLIFKKENFVKMMVDRLHTYKYQEITHNTAYLMDVSAINLDVSNILNVKKHAWIEDASINNNLDVSENLIVKTHAWIEDVSINTNLDVSNNLTVKTHAWIEDASINNNLDVSNNLRVNIHATIFDASINNNLDVSNDLVVKTHATIFDASINNNLDVSNNLIVKTHAWIEDASINSLDVSENLVVKTHAWIEDASINSLDVSNNLRVKTHATIFDASINNNLDVSENLRVHIHATIFDASINNNLDVSENLIVKTHAWIEDVSINNNLDVSNNLTVKTHAWIEDASINTNLDVSENLTVKTHAWIEDASINTNLDVSNNLNVNKHATIFDASINNNLDVSNNINSNTIHGNKVTIDDLLEVSGSIISNVLNVYDSIKFYDENDTEFMKGLFEMDGNTNDTNKYESTNNLYFLFDTSGNHTLKTELKDLNIRYTICGGGGGGEIGNQYRGGFGGEIIDLSNVSWDGSMSMVIGEGGDSSSNYLGCVGDNTTLTFDSSMIEASGGTIDTSYNSQFEYTYDDGSYNLWLGGKGGDGDDSNSSTENINEGSYGGGGGGYNVYEPNDDPDVDDVSGGGYGFFKGSIPDRFALDGSLNGPGGNGFYGGGGGGGTYYGSSTNGGKGGTGVVLITISKQEIFSSFKQSGLTNDSFTQQINTSSAVFKSVNINNNLNIDENLVVNKNATILDVSINNNLDVSENLVVNNHATIFDASINNNLDVSNNLLVKNHATIFDVSINNDLDVSNNLTVKTHASIFDASINNNLDVSENLVVKNHASIFDVSINNNLDVSENLTANVINVTELNIGGSTFSSNEINFDSSSRLNASDVSFANLDVSNHLFAKDVSINNLDVSINFNANDASINHLDISTHLFAPDASINHLDVSNHLYANDASINHLDVSDNLYANDASINNLDVSQNLTVNGVAIFNDIVRANNIDISSQILGINSGEASGNIGIMMHTDIDTSNVFFGYDTDKNYCFISKTNEDSNYTGSELYKDASDNDSFVNLQVDHMKAKKIICENFSITTNEFDNITVNENADISGNASVGGNADILNNLFCGNSIKLGNNNFSVGNIVNVTDISGENVLQLDTNYKLYTTDNWAIYVFDISGEYKMDLSILQEKDDDTGSLVTPDISFGYIVCGGGEGGGSYTSLRVGHGGAPGYIQNGFIDISNTINLTMQITVGKGGETSTDGDGGINGGSSHLHFLDTNLSNIDSLGGNNDSEKTTNNSDISYNNGKQILSLSDSGFGNNENDTFAIKLGGIGGDGNDFVHGTSYGYNIIDASCGGGGGGGSYSDGTGGIDISNGGIAGNYGLKGNKKLETGGTDPTVFIDGSYGTPFSGTNGGNGGNGYFGGGGGGGGFGGTGGTGGTGGDGVVCIIIDKAKFGSVIKDVESIQCGTLEAFQIETTKLKTKSDYRLKTNVEDLQEVYTVDNLRPVMYNINSSKEIGLIAHEIQEYYPFLVSGVKDGKEMQTVNYTGLIGVLIKEIQLLKLVVKEQSDLVKEQSELVKEQGNEIKLLKDGNN